jgi:protein-tyrosine-phosphatase
LLVVSTANVCRSPLAERIGSAYVAELIGAEAESTFRIVSAGTEAVAGREMSSDTALVLRGLGGDPDKFWAGKLSADMAGSSDLTLTMTRQHRDEVLALAPRSLVRTFTLLEAADLLTDTDVVGHPDVTPIPERARSVVQMMAATRTRRRSSPHDDIPDPMGRGVKVHQEVGEVIADAMLVVLGGLTGAVVEVHSGTARAAHAKQPPHNGWWFRTSTR